MYVNFNNNHDGVDNNVYSFSQRVVSRNSLLCADVPLRNYLLTGRPHCSKCRPPAIISVVCPSVCPSFRHIPVFCPDEVRYDRAVSSIRQENHSSFWRGKVYLDIRRESPPARALI